MIKLFIWGITGRAWISIVFGVISLLLAPYGLVAHLGEIQISLPWSLFFPILVALAFGWRHALMAGVFGGALFPFLLWPYNGWTNVFTSLIFLGFYMLLGVASERKLFIQLKRQADRIILAILVFSISSSLFDLLLFNRILEFGAPFWEPETIKTMPAEILYKIVFKDIVNVIILVTLAETSLRLTVIRRLLGLYIEPRMQKNTHIFVITMVISIFVWMIAIGLGFVISKEHNKFNDLYGSLTFFMSLTSGFMVSRTLFYFSEIQFKAKTDLKKSEEKFKALFEFANDAILIIHDDIIIDCNASALKVFGCEFEYIIGKTPAFLSPELQPDGMLSTEKARQKINKALFETYQQFEWLHQRFNGTSFETEISLTRFEINGELLLQAIIRDITESKQAERLIQEQRDLSMALSKTSTLEVGLRLCLESAMNISGMDCGGFYMVDPNTQSLNIAYHQGLPPEVIESTSSYESTSAHAQLIYSGHPIYTEHLALNVPIEEVRKREHLRAIAIIPILHEGRVISCMNIASHTLNEVPVFVREMLEVMTAQIGQVIARLRTEEALHDSEDKYRGLVENSPDAIAIYIDGKIVFVNNECLRLIGATNASELIGKSVMEFIHPDYRALVIERMKKATTEGIVLPLAEEIFLRSDGSAIEVEVKAIAIKYENKPAVQLIVRDNSERKRAQQELYESETKYRELVENLNDVIYSIGSDGIINFVSPPVRMLSGYEPEELIGASLFKLIYPDDIDFIKHGFSEVISGLTSPREYRILSKTGKVKWVRSSSRPVKIEGNTIGIQGVISDISELKYSELELRVAKDKAEESDRLKTAFLQNLSHEIRTPWNSIMGFASLLPEEDNKKLIDKYSSIIVENSEQLVHIIDDIVLYSRLQSKQLTNSLKEFDVNTLLTNILQSFNLPEFQKGINLVIHTFSTGPITINSDYEKIWQVYTNLITNAFKYTNKGTITFGITENENTQIFFVKDTGIGIPQNEIDKIFGRFYRASNVNKGVIGGTGLGLSIVAELMELLGGEIWVESEVEKGSTFYFTVPLGMAG